MVTIQNQNFGVEIELTGITRADAAKIIAKHYGTNRVETGYDYYNSRYALDTKGRKWRCMSDASITCQIKNAYGGTSRADKSYSCEVVTPILQYDDLNDLQEIVRELRAAGAIANSSCGIHVHVDGANHTPESLTRLLNFAVGRQDLFYEALQIGDRANRWCHKVSRPLFKAMKKADDKDKAETERLWYSSLNDGYTGGIDHQHYNATRYHGINLHAFFTKGTVEFRLFNGTTHAGKIKAYVQFCLAMSAWAINCENNNLYFKSVAGYTDAQKAAIMKRVLINRLGLAGPEYKTCRLHLTSVWTNAAEAA